MNITILASGSRGDVQPYVALGTGLRAAGHRVRVLTSQDFEALVSSHHLEYASAGFSAKPVAVAQVQEALARGGTLQVLAKTGQGAQQMARQMALSGLAASEDADLLVGGLAGIAAGFAIAEKRGIPFVEAHLLPLTPTREFPSVVAPLPNRGLPGWINRLSHHATRQMMWRLFQPADRRVRTEILQLPPTPFTGPFRARAGQTVLYGYSTHVLPRPHDWPANVHVTGYWFLEPPAGWTAPRELLAFLESGPPPVYVGFGSMPDQDSAATAALVTEALARSGQRGLLDGGWGGLRGPEWADSIYTTDALPHHWLFSQVAAVVHHGGAGTTAAAMRAGVPSVVTPFFGDQPFWGARTEALGVGPRSIPRRRLTVELLADAITQAVTDQEMRRRAAALGVHLRAEDGVARAVQLIEQAHR